ncbi:MAG: D-alanyl-D-alanine carboxypeptidase family protein [Gammaproteobacteria bacterium]|jgi:D-alanyl-D-alanine carboxypeptidase|nr:D-alanyl-D-alanine carboxypeptidase family protein [Gammaproteobacteria bacterium]
MGYHAHMPTPEHQLRLAAVEDFDTIRAFVADLQHVDASDHPLHDAQLLDLLQQECVLLAHCHDRLQAVAIVLLPEQQLLIRTRPDNAAGHTTACLVAVVDAAEKLASDYGVQELQLLATMQIGRCLLGSGYRYHAGHRAGHRVGQDAGNTTDRNAGYQQRWHKSLRPRLGSVRRQILEHCQRLGIAADYGIRRQLRMHRQAQNLVALGTDCFGREQLATAATVRAWQRMQHQADRDGVSLQLVSAYRSHAYQYGLIRRKLDQGQTIEQVLRVSAAPGFSEHHSGRALDLTSPESAPLQQQFATTQAFAWLLRNATSFGFVQSYPEHNRHSIDWEPWHWCYHETDCLRAARSRAGSES